MLGTIIVMMQDRWRKLVVVLIDVGKSPVPVLGKTLQGSMPGSWVCSTRNDLGIPVGLKRRLAGTH